MVRGLVRGGKGRVAFGVLRSGGVVVAASACEVRDAGRGEDVGEARAWRCGVEFAEPWARGCDWYDDVDV